MVCPKCRDAVGNICVRQEFLLCRCIDCHACQPHLRAVTHEET